MADAGFETADFRNRTVARKDPVQAVLETYRKAFAILAVAGVFGTYYVIISPVFSYGILSFFFGQEAFLPSNPSGILSYGITVFLAAASLCSASAFLIISSVFRRDIFSGMYRKTIRISTVLLAVPFIETGIMAFVSLFLSYSPGGSNTTGPTLAFNPSNPLESLAYIGAVAFLATYAVSIFSGIVIGIFYGFAGSARMLRRAEFAILSFFVFVGIFYFPFLILAGIFGFYATLPVSSVVRELVANEYGILVRVISKYAAERKTYFYTLSAGIALAVATLPVLLDLRHVGSGFLSYYTYAFPEWIAMTAAFGAFAGASLITMSALVLAGRAKLGLALALAAGLSLVGAQVYLQGYFLPRVSFQNFSFHIMSGFLFPVYYLGIFSGIAVAVGKYGGLKNMGKTPP